MDTHERNAFAYIQYLRNPCWIAPIALEEVFVLDSFHLVVHNITPLYSISQT